MRLARSLRANDVDVSLETLQAWELRFTQRTYLALKRAVHCHVFVFLSRLATALDTVVQPGAVVLSDAPHVGELAEALAAAVHDAAASAAAVKQRALRALLDFERRRVIPAVQ